MAMTDPDVRYYGWDFDSGVVTEFRRSGECNLCGECCLARVIFHVYPTGDGKNRSPSICDRNGVWAEAQREGEDRYFIRLQSVERGPEHRCPQLDANNRCLVHETKPRLHREWPFHPNQTEPFPSCSYRFEKLAEWPIENFLGQ